MRLQPVVCGCLWDVSFWGDRMRLSLCVCPCELSRCVFLSGRVSESAYDIPLEMGGFGGFQEEFVGKEWIWEICA